MSIHLVFLFRRRAGLAQEQFLRHWRDVHAPLVAALPGVRRYVRNVVLQVDGTPRHWHGVEEIWLDDGASADALTRDPGFIQGPLADETNFVDAGSVLRLRTVDHAVVTGGAMGQDDSHPKRMTFLKRKPGMTPEQLLHYWRHVHGPLAASVSGLRRYVQSTVERASREGEEPAFDGVAQIWLESQDALHAVLASPHFRDRVKPDEANFVASDLTLTLPIEEHRVIWPAEAGDSSDLLER